ncbi:MAG TPA: hypothetical protein VF163_21685 [Micromonosporaceae bacterium]
MFSSLRGRRVIVGVPGHGFRGDLRADDAVVQGGRTFVPVLTEQDYYRAELQQIEVFAPMVPIDRVWVEEPTRSAQSAWRPPGALDAPPQRDPVPAHQARQLIGRRVIQAVPDGYVRDLRACSDVYANDRGSAAIKVCGEAAWYQWALTGVTPAIEDLTTDRLWLE